MKLIYCAYPIIDQDTVPEWVGATRAHPLVRREGWSLYSPAEGFVDNFGNVPLAAALSRAEPAQVAVRNQEALKLDPGLFMSIGEVVHRIKASDEAPTTDVSFKDLYVIIRSDIVLVDLDRMDHGERSQEMAYAYLCGVPTVGIAHRFIFSPWVADKISSIVFPRTSDEIVRQVMAFDHKATAVLDYYRAMAGEAEALRKRAEELQASTEELDGEDQGVGTV